MILLISAERLPHHLNIALFCILRCWLVYFGFFPPRHKGFFPGELKSHWVPKFCVFFSVGPAIIIHLSLLYSFSVSTQIGLLGGSSCTLFLWDIFSFFILKKIFMVLPGMTQLMRKAPIAHRLILRGSLA